MIRTQIQKCNCCETRVLFIHGSLLDDTDTPSEMVPVADLSISDLKTLLHQISKHVGTTTNLTPDKGGFGKSKG